jgi:hypothetical protein
MKTPWVRVVALTLAISVSFSQGWATFGGGGGGGKGGTLNAFPTNVTVDWKDLGFLKAVRVRDLWSHAELRPASQSFSSMLPAHGARLFKVKAVGQAPVPPSQAYGAETATLYGGAQLSSCATCASGHKLTYLRLGWVATLKAPSPLTMWSCPRQELTRWRSII